MYNIIQKRKIWFTFSGLMAGASLFALIFWGLNFGIDFTGGSLLEVRFSGRVPAAGEVREAVGDLGLNSFVVQPAGEDGLILRFRETGEETHQEVLSRLKTLVGDDASGGDTAAAEDDIAGIEIGTSAPATVTAVMESAAEEEPSVSAVEELRFDAIGPSIGAELKNKSVNAMILVLIAIVLYIAWAFSRVSKPVASWKYGLTAIIALFHDVLITLGIFAVLGKFMQVEINTPFVAAILTVLGYSVNDTIVVFDRVRENLPKSDDDFEGTVNRSINQTIRRSVNTSLTTLLVLFAILFFGGGTIRDFVLALSIGIFIGTYSSIFLASPLLVIWEKMKK